MKMDKAFEAVHETEATLGKALRTIGERHAAEADLYHLGQTLSRQCAEHLRAIAPFAQRYGASPAPDDAMATSGLLDAVRRKGAQIVGRTEAAGLLLMADLKQLYLEAQHAEIAWVILVQSARAGRDVELIDVAGRCREEAELRGKWLRTRIKESAPQVYAAG
jgi:hypothetical protein